MQTDIMHTFGRNVYVVDAIIATYVSLGTSEEPPLPH